MTFLENVEAAKRELVRKVHASEDQTISPRKNISSFEELEATWELIAGGEIAHADKNGLHAGQNGSRSG